MEKKADDKLLQERKALFQDLTQAEIEEHSKISVCRTSTDKGQPNLVYYIIEATQKHARGFMPVGFRYYKDLNSGSTIFTSIFDDKSLDGFLQYSKFTQQGLF